MIDIPPVDPLFGFDSAFLHRLDRLALLSRRPMQGPMAGARRSRQHGSSVEFADFRNYSDGDDFRHIDWKAYARLDRLFLRLYGAEQMATLSLFIDHSTSMRYGRPNKVLVAARLAAVLSYVALHRYDRVAVVGWGRTVDHYLPPQVGKDATPRAWQTIAEIAGAPPAPTDFGALRDFARAHPRPGLAVVFSDYLTESDWRAGLLALRASGREVTVVQVLAPDELDPDFRGDWLLRDSETDAGVEVTISPRLLRRYLEELETHTTALRDFCRRQQITFVRMATDAAIESEVLVGLRAAGILA